MQRSKNRSGLGGRNAGGKPPPIFLDCPPRAPPGSPWFGAFSCLAPREGFGGGAPPPPTPEVADVHTAALPRGTFGAPGMRPKPIGQAPIPTCGVGGCWACLCAPDFWGGPTCAAPARPQIWVTHMRPPTQARGLYPRRGPSGRFGFPGSPAESEAFPGTYKPNPVVHGKALTRPGFFFFSHTCGTHRPATAWIPERAPRPAHTQAGTSLRPPQP